MADVKANLRTFMLTQDFDPEHWVWSPDELTALSSCDAAARIIAARFAAAGFPLEEAYAICHDKDEKTLWDEYHSKYVRKVSGPHIHFVAKLGKANALPLERIASIAGVDPAFIEKPKTGRYAYDNMLAYLIHIKYADKYQYDPQAVITLAGKHYMDYYSDRYKAWMQGRANRVEAATELTFKEVRKMIMDGKLSKKELVTNPRYKYVYIENVSAIDKLFDDLRTYLTRQKSAQEGGYGNED